MRCSGCGLPLTKFYFKIAGKLCLSCAKETLNNFQDYSVLIKSNRRKNGQNEKQ